MKDTFEGFDMPDFNELTIKQRMSERCEYSRCRMMTNCDSCLFNHNNIKAQKAFVKWEKKGE